MSTLREMLGSTLGRLWFLIMVLLLIAKIAG